MSGTSADAIDGVLLKFDDNQIHIVTHYSQPLSAQTRGRIATLCTPGGDTLDLLGSVDAELGELFAETALKTISKAKLEPTQITAIGSHGQTVRHRPDASKEQRRFTLQIGDPNIIAARTGIITAADFRRKDLALGGQGAPLAPAFHARAFSSAQENRAVVNLGGIANITLLPTTGDVTGFDTGPANTLLDYWCSKHTGQPFDENGQWASTGSIQQPLLDALLTHGFLKKDPPKSTGREEFSPQWLETIFENFADISVEDVQATLTAFTVESLSSSLLAVPQAPKRVFVCGGGSYNNYMLSLLRNKLTGITVETTDALGIDPMQVEGATFGWLAKQTLKRQHGNLKSVTGASRNAILGAIYYP